MVQGTASIESLVKQLPHFLLDLNPEIFLSDNYVVLDFETTIIDKGSPYVSENSIVCSSWKCGPSHEAFTGQSRYLQANEFNQQELVDAILSADFWVAHNTKFEYGWLERCALPLEATLGFCTMLAEYVLLGNRSNPQMLSLERCLKRRKMKTKAGIGKQLLKAGICPSTWPERWLKPYSLQDTDGGEELFLSQRKALVQYDKLKTLFTRCIFTAPLVDIEKNGMHLDPDRSPKLQKDYNVELSRLRGEIDKITGGANPGSHPQMRKVLYEDLKFPKPAIKDKKFWGKPDKEGNPVPTTSNDYIETLKGGTQKQKKFLKLKGEHSKVVAALTKCLNKFTDCINETDDHILTAAMNQAVTVTQRLSSSGKNYKAQFQNFPRIFKPLFSARHEGWSMVEIDQAQLEYRVAVWYGQDKNGLDDILNQVDSHSITATTIFGKRFVEEPVASIRKQIRTEAKAHTFKPLYGGKSGTPDEVRYYEAFEAKHYGVVAAQKEWKKSALNTGKVTIPSGLTFYFPGTKILDNGYITNSTNICNYPVQSLATADIVPVGVTYQWHLMRIARLVSFLVNTIHDSSLGEVHPDEIEIYGKIGEYAFVDLVYTYLTKVYDIDFNVPLEAEVEVNKNWSDNADWREKYLHEKA